jgi:hypothetical protein
MVAMVLSTVVVLGTWQFFINASNTMALFTGVALNDERLSMAMDLVIVDARQAGMFSTPNSEADPLICPKPLAPIRALTINDGGSLPGYDWGANNFIIPDAVTFLTPSTTTIYHPDQMAPGVVTLSARNFPVDAADMNRIFLNRILRVTSPNGFSQFTQVINADFGTGRLFVSPQLAFSSATQFCGAIGIGGADHDITVLAYIRYELWDLDGDVTTSDTALIRSELKPNTALQPNPNSLIPGTRLVVAENIVDFQVWVDGDQGGGSTNDYDETTAMADYVGSVNIAASPQLTHRARVFNVQITGRTSREFDVAPLNGRELSEEELIRSFDTDGNTTTSAPTLTHQQRIELTNLVVRNLRQ